MYIFFKITENSRGFLVPVVESRRHHSNDRRALLRNEATG